MKRFIDLLRKLGIFRSGTVSGAYTSAKDRPTELMMDNVYDAKKDLINKREADRKNQAFAPKNKKIIFGTSLVVGAVLLLIMLLGSGFSIFLLISIILWAVFLFNLQKGTISQTTLPKTIILLIGISVLTFILFIIAASSKNSSNNSPLTKNNNQSSNKIDEFVTAKEVYPELLKTAQKEWSQDAVLILLQTSLDVDGTRIENGKSNFWGATFYSPAKKMTCIYNFYGGVSKGPEEKVDKDIIYLPIKDFTDSSVIHEKAKSAGIERLSTMSLVAGDVPHYNFFSNGEKQLRIFWLAIDDTGTKIYNFDAKTGEKISL